ncbi:putative ABC transporter, ATP-binding protein [Desulfosarcina variabilis str. Montpellier]|uniref:ABC transporter ATP-binding protein n=1 Tax=Desulfosarcina variabilis TaxID=2300 RepID=UPI003AFAA3D0
MDTKAAPSPHIVVRDLTMGYQDVVLMRNLDFTVNRGDVFAIMGGSGCGKSTLLRILIGLKAPSAGSVHYGEIDFWSLEEDQRNHMLRRFGILYQSGALWSSMTLSENISLPLELYTDLNSATIREMVHFKLSLVGLAGFENYYPSEISGGMRKRAGLARAMALDPQVLFFDEPSAGLDPVSAKNLDDLILTINDSLGATVVIVTHELPSIFAIVSNAVFLDIHTRTAAATGSPRQMLESSDNAAVIRFLTRGSSNAEISKEI